MKRISTITIFAVNCFLLGTYSFAHEAHKHGHASNEEKKPNCDSIKHMDTSKIDMNDPVMKALMKKCKTQHAGHGHQSENPEKKEGTPSDSQN